MGQENSASSFNRSLNWADKAPLLLVVLLAVACQPTRVEVNSGPTDAVTPDDLLGNIPDDPDTTPDPTLGQDDPVQEDDDPEDESGDGSTNPNLDQCLEMPNKFYPSGTANVFYGTEYPTHVPLTPGQIMAIGTFWGCSGLLITPEWVLTAEHCGLSPGAQFCIGPEASNPNTCFYAQAVYDQPQGADMTLVYLGEDVRNTLPAVEPVKIITEDLDQSWIGRTVEAAGYGTDENGNSGKREFTAEPLVDLWSDMLTIDGEGQHGVCFGDSGGPVMAVAVDGSVRVIGDLSHGDSSCVGQDNFTRVDIYRSWIESHIGPVEPEGPQECGVVTEEGSCNAEASRATYCENAELQVVDCSGGDVCGWNAAAEGWRCLPPSEDSCQGMTNFGSCASGVLSWCENGEPLTRDCGFCGETCELHDQTFGFVCKPDACAGLDYTGACNGNVAEWCDNGVRKSKNCEESGQVCGWVNDEIGYYCMDDTECGELDYFGECNGDVVQWCNQEGEKESRDCSDYGATCGYVNDEIGYYCVN